MNYNGPQNPGSQPNMNCPPQPRNYLIWSILATIFCCLPLGIVSIVYSTKVNEYYAMGMYEDAVRASIKAKQWAIYAALSSFVISLIYFILMMVLGASTMMLGGLI